MDFSYYLRIPYDAWPCRFYLSSLCALTSLTCSIHLSALTRQQFCRSPLTILSWTIIKLLHHFRVQQLYELSLLPKHIWFCKSSGFFIDWHYYWRMIAAEMYHFLIEELSGDYTRFWSGISCQDEREWFLDTLIFNIV